FVIGYAYDDCWGKMKMGEFFKRRLIRLHPMIVMGALIGAAMWYVPEYTDWGVGEVSIGMLLIATLLNALLIPAGIGSEIRGLGEMYPLNGPTWSLFFEYIGNILYALILRRLSTIVLALLVLVSAIALTVFAVSGPTGDICVGYSLTGTEFTGGSFRLLF